MSTDKNLSAEDMEFKAFVTSMQEGGKFLRRYTKHTETQQPEANNEHIEENKIPEHMAKPKSKLKKKPKQEGTDILKIKNKKPVTGLYYDNTLDDNQVPSILIEPDYSVLKSLDAGIFYESLFNNLKYNLMLNLKSFLGRYIFFKNDELEGFGKIIQINGKIITIVKLEEFKEANQISFDIEFKKNIEIYLTEYVFSYNQQLYLIISRLKGERFVPLLEVFNGEKIFTGLELQDNLKLKQARLECKNLIASDNFNITDENLTIFAFNVNNAYCEFLKRTVWLAISPSDVGNYLRYEAEIENKIYLILNFNKDLNIVYLKNYLDGKCSWKAVNDIKVNFLKGRAVGKSLSPFKPSISPHFYKEIRFENLEKIEIKNNINNIIFSREIYESIIPEIECKKCTYKIDRYEYNICKFCNNAYHRQCLETSEQAVINNSWLCKTCRPCSNCHSNDDSFIRKFCTDCSKCYHLECLNPYIQQLYSVTSNVFRCEDCIQCEQCDIKVSDFINELKTSTVTWSNDLKICSTCEKRFELKEFCPICNKLWKENAEGSMVQCSCKLWVHKDCDRILTDTYFYKLAKTTYNCPDCRTGKKLRELKNILFEYIKYDKLQYFYNPVDIKVAKNYDKIIKTPMCFKFIEDKLKTSYYLEEPQEFVDDLKLIFENAKLYNMPNTKVHKEADALLQLYNKRVEKDALKLNQYSLEYFLFEYNDRNKKLKSEHLYKHLEEIIKSKFSNRPMRAQQITHIQNKLNEYSLIWPFAKDFLEKFNNSIENNSVNNFDTISMQSEITITGSIKNNIPTSNTNNYMLIKNNHDDENITDNKLNNDMSVSNDYDKDSIKHPNSSDISNPVNEEFLDTRIKVENYEDDQMIIDYENTLSGEERSAEGVRAEEQVKTDILKITVPINHELNESLGRCKELEISEKEAEIIQLKNDHHNKPHIHIKDNKKKQNKIVKTSDFQQELDCYNSNFEINKKSLKSSQNVSNKESHKQISIKMEINENPVENALALEEEEDNVHKAFELARGKDTRLSQLYLSKIKAYYNDKAIFDTYADLVNSFIALKNEKRCKKSTTNIRDEEAKQRKLSLEESSSYEAEPAVQQYLKKKKGRPKIKQDDNLITEKPVKAIKKEPQSIKKQISEANMLATQASGLTKKGSNAMTASNENRLKTEIELYDENINTKSQLPLPAFIYFSDTSLIYEINCYLCGSFDDNHLMLTCSLCFENFHTYCVSSSDMLSENVEAIKNYNWKCQNCKFCETCHTNGNEQVLLYCDSCDRAIHTYCLRIPLDVVPINGWKCLDCFKCFNCGTHEYYNQTTFKPVKGKDYSRFTRNFNHCYECGLKIFYLSMCSKCNISVNNF
jgi:hypothetical protein